MLTLCYLVLNSFSAIRRLKIYASFEAKQAHLFSDKVIEPEHVWFVKTSAETQDGRFLSSRPEYDYRVPGELFFRPAITLVENCLMEFLQSTSSDKWVTEMLRQGDAQVLKKHSQMRLQMKRDSLEKPNRRAGEMAPVIAERVCTVRIHDL